MKDAGHSRVAELLAASRDAMLRQARHILGSAWDAEDVVQDVMLGILEGPHVLDGVDRLGGWLGTVIHRRCVDFIRKAERRRRLESYSADRIEGQADGPQRAMEAKDAKDKLMREVRRLPAPLREVFIRVEIEGLKFREVAERTGVPMGTLLARKRKADGIIRQRLNATEGPGWRGRTRGG
jgi:RNA polymerase sigma factor (sigma-70 family)